MDWPVERWWVVAFIACGNSRSNSREDWWITVATFGYTIR